MTEKYHHTQKKFPQSVRSLKEKTVEPSYSNHCKKATGDRYGKIILPSKITFSGKDIIEAEMDGDSIVKIVIRMRYSKDFDICYAILYDNNFVKTVWLNDRNDNHKTLDLKNYS